MPSLSAALPEILTLEELAVRYGPVELHKPLTKSEFARLASRYPDLAMEREKDGTVTIMSPVTRGSGKRESVLIALVYLWNEHSGHGEVYSSASGFDLPDGATKSPDVAWISPERLAKSRGALSDEDAFVRIVPDFVAEIRSKTDRLKRLQDKMTDVWIANGVRLAWLIDPYEESAYVYRPDGAVETVHGFDGESLSGQEALPGFSFPLEKMKI